MEAPQPAEEVPVAPAVPVSEPVQPEPAAPQTEAPPPTIPAEVVPAPLPHTPVVVPVVETPAPAPPAAVPEVAAAVAEPAAVEGVAAAPAPVGENGDGTAEADEGEEEEVKEKKPRKPRAPKRPRPDEDRPKSQSTTNPAELLRGIVWQVWQPVEEARYYDPITAVEVELSPEQHEVIVIPGKRSVLNVPVHRAEAAHRTVHFNEPVTLKALLDAIHDFYDEPITLDDLEDIPDDNKDGGYLINARNKLLAKEHVTWLDLIGTAGDDEDVAARNAVTPAGPAMILGPGGVPMLNPFLPGGAMAGVAGAPALAMFASRMQAAPQSNGRVRFEGISQAAPQGSSRRESARAATTKYVLKLGN